MRYIFAGTLLICCCLLTAAQEPVVHPAEKARLGISIDKSATNFDGDPGVSIVDVADDSNAARIGLVAGDRIIAINDTAVTSFEVLGEILGSLKVKDRISVTVMRNGKESSCSGTLEAPVSPKDLAEHRSSLEERVAALRKQGERERYSLQELLIILRQIEQDLPAAAREFKEVYPNGRFHISINIDIDSDTTTDTKPTEEQTKKNDQQHKEQP